MTNLDTLPAHVLLSILEHFPDTYKEERIATVEWPFGPKESCRTLVPELIALGATNRQLRHALLPTIFADQNVGQVEPTKAYASKVVELSESHGEMLACIRNLTVVRLLPRGIEALAACIGQMQHLETLGWYATFPLPPIIAKALAGLPDFTALLLNSFGVESLPHVLPLADKLTKFALDTERTAPSPKSIIGLCPITVAHPRRSGLPWGSGNIATRQEQREALWRNLAPFLLRAKAKLEELLILGDGLCDDHDPQGWFQHLFDGMVSDDREYPVFAQLRCLWLRDCDVQSFAVKHLVKSCALRLQVLEYHSLQQINLRALPKPLKSLTHFCCFMQDGVQCTDLVNSVTVSSPLKTLYLNGPRSKDIPVLFGDDFRCGDTIAQLRLHGGTETWYLLSHIQLIAVKCPNLVGLDLTGCWGLEAVDVLGALKPMAKLRRFHFDHPWEKPRTSLFVEPDGRTIRSERDFRFVAVSGRSVEEEIGDRIRADINAVRPMYQRRLSTFVKEMPQLWRFSWQVGTRVKWVWTFTRKYEKDGKVKIFCEDEADVPYGKTIIGRKVEGSALMACEGLGGFD